MQLQIKPLRLVIRAIVALVACNLVYFSGAQFDLPQWATITASIAIVFIVSFVMHAAGKAGLPA